MNDNVDLSFVPAAFTLGKPITCSICGSEHVMMSVGTEPRCPAHASTRLTRLSRQVAEFHKAFELPTANRVTIPSDERVRLRLKLIGEEFVELMESAGVPYTSSLRELIESNLTHDCKVNLPEFVDALADIDYVVEGTRLEFGINGAPIADAVHAANMAKQGGHRREDGKWMKPEGWQPPDIAGELKKQGWEGE